MCGFREGKGLGTHSVLSGLCSFEEYAATVVLRSTRRGGSVGRAAAGAELFGKHLDSAGWEFAVVTRGDGFANAPANVCNHAVSPVFVTQLSPAPDAQRASVYEPSPAMQLGGAGGAGGAGGPGEMFGRGWGEEWEGWAACTCAQARAPAERGPSDRLLPARCPGPLPDTAGRAWGGWCG